LNLCPECVTRNDILKEGLQELHFTEEWHEWTWLSKQYVIHISLCIDTLKKIQTCTTATS
jgi:hypothetical protein